MTSLKMCSANFSTRIAPYDGHTPRRLHENAIGVESDCIRRSIPVLLGNTCWYRGISAERLALCWCDF